MIPVRIRGNAEKNSDGKSFDCENYFPEENMPFKNSLAQDSE